MRNSALSVVLISLMSLGVSACTVNINVPPSMVPNTTDGAQSSDRQVEMFAEMMIPHHQQAIDMSNLALSLSESDDVKDLAKRIIAGQTPEIELMATWIDDSEANGSMGMMGGYAMGGMASDEEMAALATLSGTEFDQEFLSLMIPHHEGALQMVHMIEGSSDAEVSQLAEDIVRVQTAEIVEMEALLEDTHGA